MLLLPLFVHQYSSANMLFLQVFEYFASVRTPSGEVFMTPADLMRAVVAVFPPSGSNRVREGFLRGERVPGELHCSPSKFFMLFDTNNDGLISFPEWVLDVFLKIVYELYSHLTNLKESSNASHWDYWNMNTKTFCSIFNYRYIFFVTLLSIPELSFSVAFKMFDLNNNGFVTWFIVIIFSVKKLK